MAKLPLPVVMSFSAGYVDAMGFGDAAEHVERDQPLPLRRVAHRPGAGSRTIRPHRPVVVKPARRICQLDLFADRTSAHTMRANQLRLWFASMAYVLITALRRIGLKHTRFAQASCGSIRLKLLKIGALVTTSVRRVKIAMASGCPYAHEFGLAHAFLASARR
jgi:hypothetical protein